MCVIRSKSFGHCLELIWSSNLRAFCRSLNPLKTLIVHTFMQSNKGDGVSLKWPQNGYERWRCLHVFDYMLRLLQLLCELMYWRIFYILNMFFLYILITPIHREGGWGIIDQSQTSKEKIGENEVSWRDSHIMRKIITWKMYKEQAAAKGRLPKHYTTVRNVCMFKT